MNKLYVHSALGSGRSTAYSRRAGGVTIFLHQFHVSAIRSQDDGTQGLSQNPRKQRNQSITRLTQSLSEQAQAFPQPLIRHVTHDSPSPIDARNLAASPPTSAIRNIKPGQQQSLRESLTREPQNTPARRGSPQDAGAFPRVDRTNLPPRTRNVDERQTSHREASPHRGTGPREPRSRPRGQQLDTRTTSVPRSSSADYQQLEQENLVEDPKIETQQPTVYQPPTELSLEDLAGYSPSLPLGEWARTEIVADRVRGGLVKLERERERKAMLASHWVDHGLFARTWSKQERIEVKDLVAKNLAGKGDEEAEVGDLLTEEQRGEMVEGLLGGNYDEAALGKMDGDGGEGKTLEGVRRMCRVNGSYLPGDEDKVVEKIRGLLPVAKGSVKGGNAKTARA